MSTFMAIDPMALVLSDKAYQIYVELKHPHTPALDAVKQVMQRLSPDERRLAMFQAQSLVEYGRAVIASGEAR